MCMGFLLGDDGDVKNEIVVMFHNSVNIHKRIDLCALNG